MELKLFWNVALGWMIQCYALNSNALAGCHNAQSLVDKAIMLHKLLHNSTGKMASCQDAYDICLYNQKLNLRTVTHNKPSYKQH